MSRLEVGPDTRYFFLIEYLKLKFIKFIAFLSFLCTTRDFCMFLLLRTSKLQICNVTKGTISVRLHPFPWRHENLNNGNQRQPTATNGNQRQPAATSGNQRQPTATNGNQRQPTATNGNQRQPTATNGNQRQPTATNGNQRQPTATNGNQRQPTATNGNQRQPTATNGNQRQPTATNQPILSPPEPQGLELAIGFISQPKQLPGPPPPCHNQGGLACFIKTC